MRVGVLIIIKFLCHTIRVHVQYLHSSLNPQAEEQQQKNQQQLFQKVYSAMLMVKIYSDVQSCYPGIIGIEYAGGLNFPMRPGQILRVI